MTLSLSPRWAAITTALVMGTTAAWALTAEEVRAQKDQIQTQYRDAKAQCKNLSGNAQDVCEEEAEGRKKIAEADLDYRRDPSDKHRYDLAKAKADAEYAVAKEKCDDLKGQQEDICEKEAKAAHVRALEAAKVDRARAEPAGSAASQAAHVSEARKDASENVRKAEYDAARERCDTLAGDAKTTCINDAKRRFGQ